MKNMRKLISFVLALMIVLSLSVTAFATVGDGNDATTEKCTITIENSATGHTYEAYQILKGDPYIEKDDNGKITKKTLVNIEWGKNTGRTGDVSETDMQAIKNGNASQFVVFTSTPAGTASTNSDGKYVISDLEPGYYLVRDNKDTLDNTHDAHTAFILEIVESSVVSPKSAKPTVDKQVWDETTDAEQGSVDGWGETADHAINEQFQYKLIANIPADDNFKYYSSYQIVFQDEMSAGITFENIVSVKVGNTELTQNQYTCTAEANQAGGSWSLTIADLTQISGVTLKNGTTVEVIYNAHLNEAARIGNDDTNKNTVYLQYSNNPNADGSGDMGKTAEDHVWVFTYEVENTKTNDQNEALPNAGFKLYKDAERKQEYLLTYDNTLNAYRPVKGTETGVEMRSDANGEFNIVGLDAGTYYLHESDVPAGYNPCDDLTIVISATHTEDVSRINATTTIASSSNLSNTVINYAGMELPETGGIGTTILYVAGGILVLAAVILLVTKKRMNAE